ncbi:MAG TPA: hypothetical protein PK400_00340 [Phycisphaerales bacterium]|nr:hypothetical protein [Phycisphaerales bacterium]
MTVSPRNFITVVSGVPRSGTSLAMQMLHAGGMPAITDASNPRGYFEFEPVKQLRADQQWLRGAAGKAVKIIHLLLTELPVDRDYRVLFMQRDLAEVVRSQAAMLERSGKTGGGLGEAQLAQTYAGQVARVKSWLRERPCFRVMNVPYAELVKEPLAMSHAISDFLGGGLDVNAMAGAVEPLLYRHRSR